ncbi:unnamed protein product [Vitrella brassicaformis CCMP3155]|uniref:Uncharacterized protein n=1 Tax=Vitrella brassicaformis (strain CCMP3155) TaxID=1169540 RepID=A0A0G4GMW5_VITBC|nr:unnamed protein product [Vitrella brassicaformis CCMP3155]|eukprot:CEM31470.1 unnamed protein product [Vitrella brassicaformis CCMP3155]
MQRHFAKKLKPTKHLLDRLPQLEDPQSAYQLLRLCATPKFHYHIHTSAPFAPPLHEAADKHTGALIQAACTLFSLGDIRSKTIRQLKLPLFEGGFALTDMARIAPAAYFGVAGLEALQWVQDLQAAYDHLVAVYPPPPQSDPLPDIRSLMLRLAGGLQSKLTHRIHQKESASLQATLDAMRFDGHRGWATPDGSRLQSCKGSGASAWLQAIPSCKETTLSPETFVFNAQWSLGLVKTPTTCGACHQPCDPHGDHMPKCLNGAYLTDRHNAVKATVYRICKEAHCPSVKQEQPLRDYLCPFPQTTDDKKRMDLVITQIDGSKLMVDVAGTHPTHADHPGEAKNLTNQRPGTALRLREAEKRSKYAVACARGGFTFLPLVFESYGRWSPTMEKFLHKLGKAVKEAHFKDDRDFSTGRIVARWWILLSCAVRREAAATVLGKSEVGPDVRPFPTDEI